MSTPATPFAGAAPRLSPARVIAVIATSVLVLFGVLLGGRAFIAAAGGPGYVRQGGVVRACRGRRYGQRLLELATCALVEAGCRSLVADVDITNTPMAAAFARVGWTVAEQRIDMLPRELLLAAAS